MAASYARPRAMAYGQVADTVRDRLLAAHDPAVRLRSHFFQAEQAILDARVRGADVLVAGAGLGHDSFALAAGNRRVVGIELLPSLTQRAEAARRRLGLANVHFVCGDFNQPPVHGAFDVAVLNMCTLCTLAEPAVAVSALLRVARRVYADAYLATDDCAQLRLQMHAAEGWTDVALDDHTVVSSDGLWSRGYTVAELQGLARSARARVEVVPMPPFAHMAVFTRLGA
jgi:SAM-dependent methyltransferase